MGGEFILFLLGAQLTGIGRQIPAHVSTQIFAMPSNITCMGCSCLSLAEENQWALAI